MNRAESERVESARPSFFVGTLAVLCLGLAGIVVALVLRNRELSDRVDELSRLAHAAGGPPGLGRAAVPALEGLPFPAEELFDPAGTPIGLGDLPESHATLLLISSTTCEYCELALPTWESIARRASGTNLRVLGLVLDATPLELETRSAPYPLLTPADPTLARRIPGVPAALLLDATGRVARSVYGGDQTDLEGLVDEFLARGLPPAETQGPAPGR